MVPRQQAGISDGTQVEPGTVQVMTSGLTEVIEAAERKKRSKTLWVDTKQDRNKQTFADTEI